MAETKATPIVRTLSYITLADQEFRPLGIVEWRRTGWSVACDQCRHVEESTDPDEGVERLIHHIERQHIR